MWARKVTGQAKSFVPTANLFAEPSDADTTSQQAPSIGGSTGKQTSNTATVGLLHLRSADSGREDHELRFLREKGDER